MSADVFPLLMKALGETVAMVAVSLMDKSEQQVSYMQKLVEPASRGVKLAWTLLIIVMIGLYIFFNGH